MLNNVELSQSEFKQIASYILEHFGLNLMEKKSLVKNRLINMVLRSSYSSFTEFFKAASQDKTGLMMASILDQLTTNHTFFYREKEHFELLINTILPQLLKDLAKNGESEIRIWSAGCSTGEEPYTLSIILQEFFKKKPSWQFDILATDISKQVLNIALKGVYPKLEITKLKPELQDKYFKHLDSNNVLIKEEIKKHILFKRLNLAGSDFPFKKKFHIIFCRNVMIYFKEDFKLKLINQFYKHTHQNGYLFIGHSEALLPQGFLYKKLLPTIYTKGSATK